MGTYMSDPIVTNLQKDVCYPESLPQIRMSSSPALTTPCEMLPACKCKECIAVLQTMRMRNERICGDRDNPKLSAM